MSENAADGSEDASAHRQRVPVILITGYAGSGKTQLVNELLALCRSRGLAAGVSGLAAAFNEAFAGRMDGPVERPPPVANPPARPP